MEEDFLNHLREQLGLDIKSCMPVAGGDINNAHLLKTRNESYFVKWNNHPLANQMLQTESSALEAIEDTKTISVPTIIKQGSFEDKSYLVLEYIEPSSISNLAEPMTKLGHQLAQLHVPVNENFGWSNDNFIGTLVQHNNQSNYWDEFYITQRLEIQIDLAKSNNHLHSIKLNSLNRFFKETSALLNGCKASLLHGDLWSGNYIVSQSGIPYLIDPASYFGHAEVDLAMSELFGRFDENFYSGYDEIAKISVDYNERKEIYQLYYLLVHLKLFGVTYESACTHILRKFD